jgi:uncharacterized protein (DUF2147 family)
MYFKNLAIILTVFLMSMSQVFAKPHRLSGLWETIDDRTGQKKSIIKIYKKGEEYRADIVKVYWKDGDHHFCVACKDKIRHNQSIEGMNFLWGLKKHSTMMWDQGHILDPHNGKVYNVRIKQNKDILYVRAFLGVPLLGRTQEWHRYQA